MTGLVDPTKTKRKYANIKNFLDGPSLMQRTDAHEVEVLDDDKGEEFYFNWKNNLFLDVFVVKSQHKSAEQGVWLGVFCPTVQNIFGIILFIRFPSITGNLK